MKHSKNLRIACGQGFWGDWLEAPMRLIDGGEIDFLVLDYLAEVTMSILAKQQARDPRAGFARDFVTLIERSLPELKRKNIRVIANAGGVNPQACAEAVCGVATKQNVPLKVAVVEGDALLHRLDELLNSGEELKHLESGTPLESIRSHILSANAYIGAEAVTAALDAGAEIVICGRVSDPSLALAPLRHHFSWPADAWNLLASGTVAGHLIECGAQVSGGNLSLDWESVPDPANIGFPIVEVEADGSFTITKQKGSGGRVSLATVKEQLVYEVGDPSRYITPDVVADFTSLRLTDLGDDRVRVEGVSGTKATDSYKVSISYANGFSSSGTLVYSWPDAVKKAKRAGEIVNQRLANLGLNFEKVHTEIIGYNACHGSLGAVELAELPEAMLRIAVRGQCKEHIERFTREISPLVLSGPPGATAYAGGKRQVQELVAYWPALVSRKVISPSYTIL